MNFTELESDSFTENTTNFFNDQPQILSEEDILGYELTTAYLTIRGLQGFIAIVANLLTIIAVCKYEFLWEECTSRFVVSLTCADLGGGVMAFFEISRTMITATGSIWAQLCYTELFLNLISGCGNFYNILLISIDRYIYITFPLQYRSIVTQLRTSLAIIIVWCILVSQNVLLLVFALSGTIDKVCTLHAALPILLPQVFIVTALVVPCYVRIMLAVQKLTKSEPHLSCFPQDLQEQQREKLRQRKMAKTMAYVLGPFLFCFYFTTVYNIVISNLYTPPFPFGILILTRISQLIFWFQNLINPFIYGWKNQQFQKAFRKLFSESKLIVFRFSGRVKDTC